MVSSATRALKWTKGLCGSYTTSCVYWRHGSRNSESGYRSIVGGARSEVRELDENAIGRDDWLE